MEGDGGGTVFRLNKDGSGFEVLLELGALAEDPRIPSPVAVGSDGRLYGISYQGGLFGAGTVFQMNQDGSGLVVLKHFDAGNNLGRNDGAIPYSALTEGSDGALYGTASSGGAANSGTVYRMNKDGSGFAVLRSLDPTTDGAAPHAAVIEDGDGVLYGTTSFGGLFGGGTVFRMLKNGSEFTVLRHFDSADGVTLFAGLIEGSDGWLYGAAADGGAYGGGTVFRLTKDGGQFDMLRSFDGVGGWRPFPGLTEGSDGALYGAANAGGLYGYGTVFRMSKDGTQFDVLWNFNVETDCGYPNLGLIEGGDGLSLRDDRV